MAELANVAPAQTESEVIVFHGKPRNMAVGVAFVLAGARAFFMGMTGVFFSGAKAGGSLFWGLLFLFSDVIEATNTYTVTDQALVIRSPWRFWTPIKEWDWEHILRADVIVRRADAKIDDAQLQFYFTAAGDTALEREDLAHSPHLAQLVIDRAKLKPTNRDNPTNLEELPQQKTTYVWNKSGRLAQG